MKPPHANKLAPKHPTKAKKHNGTPMSGPRDLLVCRACGAKTYQLRVIRGGPDGVRMVCGACYEALSQREEQGP